jgi:Trk K+ transport system NAD-binding subunit
MSLNHAPSRSLVVVCGLGLLGQHCAGALPEFGVITRGIDLHPAIDWEVPGARAAIADVLCGDCRDPQVLRDAGVEHARAILIVTDDERVNVAAAFAARALNPAIRIVIRSAQSDLNDLLRSQLGDFAAFDPPVLSADAFALAALGDEILGLFELDGRLIRVEARSIEPGHRWLNSHALADLDGKSFKLLSHTRDGEAEPDGFYRWNPAERLRPGDTIVGVELDAGGAASGAPRAQQSPRPAAERESIAERVRHWWRDGTPMQRGAAIGVFCILGIYLLGVVLYKQHYKDISLHDALNVSMVLIIGGYDNLFGSLKLPFPIPGWLHVFSVLETVAGTIFVGIVYAFITERVLSARFRFLQRRPALPRSGHIIIVGLGRVGRRVAAELTRMKEAVVGIDAQEPDPSLLPKMPVLSGDPRLMLRRARVATAKSVVVLTDGEVENLELALNARSMNPQAHLVIRTEDPYFSRNVSQLVPRANALGIYALAADAFSASAFGEHVISLFHVNGRTALVTEYQIVAGDTLAGLLLAEVAYGYGVVPLLHQTAGGPPDFLPSNELRLAVGDRMVVLATSEGLQAIEQGKLHHPAWTVRVQSAQSADAAFTAALAISRISGCPIETARELFGELPQTLPQPMYRQQAQHLASELQRLSVNAEAVAA